MLDVPCCAEPSAAPSFHCVGPVQTHHFDGISVQDKRLAQESVPGRKCGGPVWIGQADHVMRSMWLVVWSCDRTDRTTKRQVQTHFPGPDGVQDVQWLVDLSVMSVQEMLGPTPTASESAVRRSWG